MGPAAPLGCSDSGLWHAQQNQPLPRGACQRSVAGAQDGKILFLRAAPVRDQQIDERCARADHIVDTGVSIEETEAEVLALIERLKAASDPL